MVIFFLNLNSSANGSITRVSITSFGKENYGGGTIYMSRDNRATVSADGCLVAFGTQDSGLVPDDTNGESDVFVRDECTQTTTIISRGPSNAQADGWVCFFSQK